MRRFLTETGRVAIYGQASSSLRMIVGATSVIYLMSHGVTLAQIGAMKAMQATVVLLLDVPLGYLADRWGRRNLICMANIATALWLGLTALGGADVFDAARESYDVFGISISISIVLFFIAEAFNAFALAAFNGAFSAALLETYERQNARRDFENILGLYGKWQFALMALAAFVGAWAGGGASAIVWWVSAGATLALALTTRFFVRAPFIGASVKSSPSMLRDLQEMTGHLSLSRSTLLLGASYVLFLLCYQILLQFWQPLISSFAIDDQSGWLYGVAFVLFLVAQSVASEHARTQRSIKIYLSLSFLLTLLFGALYYIGIDVSLTFMLIVLVAVFYLLKLLAIAFFPSYSGHCPDICGRRQSLLSRLRCGCYSLRCCR